jgi:thiol-disulfide isomerase/thioredoxin
MNYIGRITFFLCVSLTSFQAKAEIRADSTTINIFLAPGQATVLTFYDANYQNKKILFKNSADTSANVGIKILIDKPTEFAHFNIRRILDKRIEIDQRFYLAPGTVSNFKLGEQFKLVSNEQFAVLGILEQIDNVFVDLEGQSKFQTQKQLLDYLQKIKENYINANNILSHFKDSYKITGLQFKWLQTDLECRYFRKFFTYISHNKSLSLDINNMIYAELSVYKSKISDFQTIRSQSVINSALSILYYLASSNYALNFDKITRYALENLKEVAVPTLFRVMQIIPGINNDEYKHQVEKIKKFCNQTQLIYIESYLNINIKSPESILLISPQKKTIKTLKSILEENRGKLILIDFWASWCVPCRQEIPILVEKQKQYKSNNIVFIGISIDEDEKLGEWLNALKMDKQFFNSNHYKLKNPKGSIFLQDINLQSIPKYVLLDGEGKILLNNFPRPSEPDFDVKINNYLRLF